MFCRKHFLSHNLFPILSKAINDSFFIQQNSNEPQRIANLAYYLPKMLNDHLITNSFHPYLPNITCGSVFVHGTPLIAPCAAYPFPDKKPKSVEIGDLLLISTIHKNNITRRKALLLQAKIVKHTCHILRNNIDNPNQYHMYLKWPPFKYSKGIKLLGNLLTPCKKSIDKKCTSCTRDYIDLASTHLRAAAQYLFIYDSKCKQKFPCMNCLLLSSKAPFCYNCLCPSQKVLTNPCYTAKVDKTTNFNDYMSFNCMLTHFILGEKGKLFYPNSNNSTWDILVNDLITVTGNKTSKFIHNATNNNNGIQSGSRKQNILFFLQTKNDRNINSFLNNSILTKNGILTKDTTITDEPPFVSYTQEEDDNIPRGISIIEFVVDYDNLNEPTRIGALEH